MTDQAERTVAVRTLNDTARVIPGVTCRANMTVGILTLSEEDRAVVLHNVTAFSNFDADNDTYGERDFGTIYRLTLGEWSQKRPNDSTAISGTVLWKNDYYDNNLEFGSSEL